MRSRPGVQNRGGSVSAEYNALIAATAMDHGWDHAAERWALDGVARDPEETQCWLILAQLGMRHGRPDAAERFLDTVLRLRPGHRCATELLEVARRAPLPPEPTPGGVLVIREWGCGFWSDFDHVMGGLLLAELTGRTPVVLWGRDSLFRDPSDLDAWTHYFEHVSAIDPASVLGPHQDIFPLKWRGRKLDSPDPSRTSGPDCRIPSLLHFNRAERIGVTDFWSGVVTQLPWIPPSHPGFAREHDDVYRALVTRYIRPRAAMIRRADEFAARHLTRRPVLAVHVRGTDKASEVSRLGAIHAELDAAAAHHLREHPEGSIFLMTDSAVAADRLSKEHRDRIVLTPAARSSGEQGLH